MNLAVIDYGSGNLASAARGLELAASRLGIGARIAITDEPDAVARADRIVLPGQGAFADCARGLAAKPGLRDAMLSRVENGAPFLGICVGMQLMAARGLEHEITQGFGWIEGDIAPIAADGLRLPHMGWNELSFTPGAHPLLEGIEPGDHAYFVHSYALASNTKDVIATTDYGTQIVAMVASGNRAGTQFHVEKSQEVGLTILANFLRWTPQ
ncbi:imidazole glycerol phosphate synthase subunit HisH [Acidiphilium sp. AL]|uniref:Imidazole glycerol phosphate synthase subunit HisH n=1 Tax=Acidiphilium iwatense TaxID=768198 RepID=A0ABS9DSJ4_9PROT|nr:MULTISPECIES: imidazole glycerol phosphate synthase subunit HisH [Acidiphilium]MCF3945662.1 imidazole glycerol phosphate synthase subunit HisH [Acidiphilium iwatense]MCU4159532.1 imidazole glycerol phosphate synthase subunit HisH [Acidiphilium sp. AL]